MVLSLGIIEVFFYLVVLCVVSPQTENQEINYEKETVSYLCKFLIETDKKLNKEYRTRPKGNGETIINLVKNYNKAMTSIVSRAKHDETIGKNCTISEAEELIDYGGPEFVHFYVDTPLHEVLFGLNNVSSKVLHNERHNTVKLWQEFFKCYSKIPDEDDVSFE